MNHIDKNTEILHYIFEKNLFLLPYLLPDKLFIAEKQLRQTNHYKYASFSTDKYLQQWGILFHCPPEETKLQQAYKI